MACGAIGHPALGTGDNNQSQILASYAPCPMPSAPCPLPLKLWQADGISIPGLGGALNSDISPLDFRQQTAEQ